MAIDLPTRPYQRPALRILARTPKRDGPAGWSAWQPLPMAQRLWADTWSPGFIIDSWRRRSLPMIGEALFRYQVGQINGKRVGGTDQAGNPIPADLYAAEVRLQTGILPPTDPEQQAGWQPQWRTAWWGTVELQSDEAVAGERRYHCFDGLYRAKHWRMTSHRAVVDGQDYYGRGQPGYNLGVEDFYARSYGNKCADPAKVYDEHGDLPDWAKAYARAFTWNASTSGANAPAEKWTDLDVVRHLLVAYRGPSDPVFKVDGTTELLSSGIAPWAVRESAPAWDLLARICDRKRGRGLVYCDWEDDSAALAGDDFETFQPRLMVAPPFRADLTYTPPGGSQVTLPGSTTAGRAGPLDLAGDQRLVEGSLRIGDRYQWRYDYIENIGERLQVAVTVSPQDGSLGKRWSSADQTSFLAVTDPRRRNTARWDPVFQRFGLPPDWDLIAKDGNNANPERMDYYCEEDGSLAVSDDSISRSSILTIRLLGNLPFYEGWNYASTPARYDSAQELLAPPRRPILVLQRQSGDQFLDLTRLGFSAQVDPSFGVLIRWNGDQNEAVAGRWFGGAACRSANIPAAAEPEALVLTLCLELGERVRFASGNPEGRRRQTIEHPGIHLWLAHPGCIWELDRALSSIPSAAAKRAPAGATLGSPGILRDDRAYLAQLHALSCVWYLQDHRTLTWSLKDCAALGRFAQADGTITTYHRIGDLVTDLSYRDRAGVDQVVTADTPVTSEGYDAAAGIWTWETDWSELDLA